MNVKLNQIASFSKGKQINGKELLETGIYDYLNGGINPSGKWNEFNVEGNTIAISEGGNSCGYVNYMDSPFWCGAHCYYLFDIKCDVKYLYYVLKSQQDRLMRIRTGACMPNIKKNDLGNFEFRFDDNVTLQKCIVYELDFVESLITARREQLAKLGELVKSRFIEIFGHQSYNEKQILYGRIEDVAEIYLGLTHTPTYVEKGVKFISAKNTSSDYLDLSDVKYISREEFENAPLGAKPQIGDVLFSRVGSNLGHPVILDVDEELCTFVSLGFLRAKGQVTNIYLKHWMRDDFFAEQVAQKVVGGGQPNLNTGWLKEFKIIIPPIELQEQFASFVSLIDKSKFDIQKSLEKLETLKEALMQKYFG